MADGRTARAGSELDGVSGNCGHVCNLRPAVSTESIPGPFDRIAARFVNVRLCRRLSLRSRILRDQLLAHTGLVIGTIKPGDMVVPISATYRRARTRNRAIFSLPACESIKRIYDYWAWLENHLRRG